MKKIVITMLVLLSAAYAVGIGGGEVARKLNLRPSQIVPAADTLPVRNLIYLIGDGMGLSHVSMLMLEEGYGTTAFDRAQNIALITTYSANNRVTDSAAAGTALET
jgi:alkaline phosphatase